MPPYDAVLFDLLTALLDSWSLWNSVAGGQEAGLRWRKAYLHLTYGVGGYRPYEELVRHAAGLSGLPLDLADHLLARWDELAPWPEAPDILGSLRASGLRLGIVTNCSEDLGRRAAAALRVSFDTIVTAERAGYFKPDPHPYELALSDLGLPAERTLFVAGSPADVPGVSAVGMPVVWHNRIGLPALDSGVAPLAIYPTLDPLMPYLVWDSRHDSPRTR